MSHHGEIDLALLDTSVDLPLWRRVFNLLTLSGIGFGLGFLIPYVWHLNKQVGERFATLQWQIPTRVYARPLQLQVGMAMDVDTLRKELDASAYLEDDLGLRPGSFLRDGNRFVIANRGYTDIDGPVAAQRIEVVLSGQRLADLRLAENEAVLTSARLDPSRIATLYGQKQEERRLVQIDDVPELLVTGLQAVEDRNFASHRGIDLRGMARATWVLVKSRGKVKQGASTLTQQLARSGLLGIGQERTLWRKFNEMLYALILEARYDKHTLLETYLNQVYLGQRGNQAIHGVAAGAEFWFGRDLNTLETEHIALLVALVKGPSHYDARRFPERAIERRNVVLGVFHEQNLIDEAEYQRARAAPLGVTVRPGHAAANRFPAYIDLVRRQLASDYPEQVLRGAGLTVFTGMSPSAQYFTEEALTDTLNDLQTANRPELQAGAIVTDVHGGEVLAAVGSHDVDMPGFNRVVEAHRPVGSLLKPFVYLLALAQPQRYSLATWVEDTPVSVPLPRGRQWTPANSDNRSHGTVRLQDALAHSYNQAAVRVGMDVSPERLAELINVLAGIKADPNPALILGATDQSPYAMAQLYQFLASGGEIQPLRAVRGVLDPEGRLLTRYDKTPDPAQVGDAIAANLITVALQRSVTSGTGRRLLRDGLGRLSPAGKTGTSNDGRDSWFAGYTGDHLAVIWVGNDQNEQTGLYGATGAMRIWSGLFSRMPSAPLRIANPGIAWYWVQGEGGLSTDETCPGAQQFAFVAGFAPPYESCVPPSPEIPAAGAETSGWQNWLGLER